MGALYLGAFRTARGSWKNTSFKKYNFDADGIPTNGGALHPLLKVREEFRNIFLEMGYVTIVVLYLNTRPDSANQALQRWQRLSMLTPDSGISTHSLYLNNIPHEIFKTLSIYLVRYRKPIAARRG